MNEHDELPHPSPTPDPRWREGYHFNGYDPASSVGLSISIGIRPALGVREEVVMIHRSTPLAFLNLRNLEGADPLRTGSLSIEPRVPLQHWSIQMADVFQTVGHQPTGDLPQPVELALTFEADGPPHAYATERGERYEQPGRLAGWLRVGDERTEFAGAGIRDHSWEIRDLQAWGQWTSLMARLDSKEALSYTCIQWEDRTACDGWRWDGTYEPIHDVHVHPLFDADVLRECQIAIRTDRGRRDLHSRLISFIPISPAHLAETVVRLAADGAAGYGFLWYKLPSMEC